VDEDGGPGRDNEDVLTKLTKLSLGDSKARIKKPVQAYPGCLPWSRRVVNHSSRDQS
jgi:hypothetical protein